MSTAFTSKSEGDNDVESHAHIRGEHALTLPGLFTLHFISFFTQKAPY